MGRKSAKADGWTAEDLAAASDLDLADYLFTLLNAWKKHGYHLRGFSGVQTAARDLAKVDAPKEDAVMFAAVFAARASAAKAIEGSIKAALEEAKRRYGARVEEEAAKFLEAIEGARADSAAWLARHKETDARDTGEARAGRQTGRESAYKARREDARKRDPRA